MPSKPAYGVYVTQLVRIGHTCEKVFPLDTAYYLLNSRLVKQVFLYNKLIISFKGVCSEIITKFRVSVKNSLSTKYPLDRS